MGKQDERTNERTNERTDSLLELARFYPAAKNSASVEHMKLLNSFVVFKHSSDQNIFLHSLKLEKEII